MVSLTDLGVRVISGSLPGVLVKKFGLDSPRSWRFANRAARRVRRGLQSATQTEPAYGLRTVGYRTRMGDTFAAIAEETLGDGSRWREIWELNRRTVPNPRTLLPGVVLVLPRDAKSQER